MLVAAASVGAKVMWYIDDREAKNLDQQVFSQLLKGARYTAVDVHKIGLHGKWVDVHHDEDCGDLPSPQEQQEVAIANAKARSIFTTPGGAYTASDIRLNGTITPYERFNGVMFMYSQKAKVGEPIDPITQTKTSGAFDWYVGGKCYHFSSIPSLEQFVIQAKSNPKSILPPEAYVQKDSSTRLASR